MGTELTTESFTITLPDGADLVEEVHDSDAEVVDVWRYLGPRTLFWTVSTHTPDVATGLEVGSVFGTALARYRSQPAFVSLWEAEAVVPTGIRLSTSVSFRDSQLAPVRVDATAIDLSVGRVLMLQLAVADWEPPDLELMAQTIETLRISSF